jgi:hypothetical protein
MEKSIKIFVILKLGQPGSDPASFLGRKTFNTGNNERHGTHAPMGHSFCYTRHGTSPKEV